MSSRGAQLCAVQSHGDCDTSEVRTYMSRFQRGLAPTSHRCRFPIAAPRLAPLSVHCGNTLESAARVVFPRASLPLGTNTNLAPPCAQKGLERLRLRDHCRGRQLSHARRRSPLEVLHIRSIMYRPAPPPTLFVFVLSCRLSSRGKQVLR